MQIDPKTTLVEKEGVSTSGTEERQCILDMRIKGSVALKAENVLSAAKLELDDVPVAVVYHNVIDKIGDSRDSETRVFEEFDRAFSEIEDLVQILVQAGCGKVVITADHGFLYQAEKA
jgi:Fe2+ or Zn2+ uptake regulation protein